VQRPVRSPGAPIIKLYLCLVQDHLPFSSSQPKWLWDAITALKSYIHWPSLLPKSLWDGHDSPEVLFILPKFAAQNAFEMLMTALKFYLHWPSLLQKLRQKCWQYWHATVTNVLALATVGDATKIGLVLLWATSPKVAKASTVVNVVCWYRQHFCLDFVNKLEASKADIFMVQNCRWVCKQTLPVYGRLEGYACLVGTNKMGSLFCCCTTQSTTYTIAI
jgi:hypothetical protein